MKAGVSRNNQRIMTWLAAALALSVLLVLAAVRGRANTLPLVTREWKEGKRRDARDQMAPRG